MSCTPICGVGKRDIVDERPVQTGHAFRVLVVRKADVMAAGASGTLTLRSVLVAGVLHRQSAGVNRHAAVDVQAEEIAGYGYAAWGSRRGR